MIFHRVTLTNPSTAYSPQLGTRLNISHTQLNIIGIAPSCTRLDAIGLPSTRANSFFLVATSLGGPLFGRIADSRGPRMLLFGAFISLISGYMGMKLLYDSGLPPDVKALPNLIFGALILCSLLTGLGGSLAYTASVNSTAKTFPDTAVSESGRDTC